jgi:hypothetical protein
MGWRLVREILDCCPDVKYREFRVLVALALDARDETRQGMPGIELLTQRANCGMRTTRRAMTALRTAGIVKTVRAPSPGVRAVYEILPMAVDNSSNVGHHVGPRTGDRSGATWDTMLAHERGTPWCPPRSQSSSHSAKSSISARDSRTLAAIDPSVTDDETTEVLQILASRGARSPGAVLRTEIVNGNGHALIMEARHRLDRAQWAREAFEAMPEPATYPDRCPSCGRAPHTGHKPGCPGEAAP